MRLQPEQAEVTLHGALGQATDFGKGAHAPVGGALRAGGQGLLHQPGHLLLVIGARRPRGTLCVQPGKPPGQEAPPPQAHRRQRDPQALGNRGIGVSRGRPQHDLCPPHQGVRQRPRAAVAHQLHPLPGAQDQLLLFRSSGSHDYPPVSG
jgi:hypothetical protein